MQNETLNKLVLARLLCLPRNMVAAKNAETARKRIYDRVEKDLLKLFPEPPLAFQQQLQALVQQALDTHMSFSGTLLQLSEQAQEEASAFLNIQTRRALAELTWEQVRTIYLIAIALDLPPAQQDRVKNESKLQASILVRYHHRLNTPADLFHGTLGQVARELARVAIGARSSRIGDLKKTLLQDWAAELMQAYLGETKVLSAPLLQTEAVAPEPMPVTVKRDSKVTKTAAAAATNGKTPASRGLVSFAEQVEAVLPTVNGQQQPQVSIVQAWQQWRSDNPQHVLDLVTFKQLLAEANKRHLLHLTPAPASLLPAEELQDSAVNCGEQVCHLVQSCH